MAYGELGLNNIDSKDNSGNYVSLINTENKEIAANLWLYKFIFLKVNT